MTQKVFDNILITLRLNKPAYVKMCILGLGKVLVYEFNYNSINNKYGSKVSLLFTNTNGLVSEIKSKYISEDFNKN